MSNAINDGRWSVTLSLHDVLFLRSSAHDLTSVRFGLSTTFLPLDFQRKQKVSHTRADLYQFRLWTIIGVWYTNCWVVARVGEIGSVASSRSLRFVIFFEREILEKFFFIIRLLQSLYESRTSLNYMEVELCLDNLHTNFFSTSSCTVEISSFFTFFVNTLLTELFFYVDPQPKWVFVAQ